jgi:hypothetical protein
MPQADSTLPFLDVRKWRTPTRRELSDFLDTLGPKSERRKDTLVVRTHLRPVDVYTYLVARFGRPNGFQNLLRRDSSDNWIHWDFVIKAGQDDVYLAGTSREIHIAVPGTLTDEQWKTLILAIKGDFANEAKPKSEVTRSLEKFVIFENKFVSLAQRCAELHAEIVDAPPYEKTMAAVSTEQDLEETRAAGKRMWERARSLYGNCLTLRLLTPIMVEAFINMIILIFCKDAVRNDAQLYQDFLRAHIPERLRLLSKNCDGFAREVNNKSSAYRAFMNVVNKRNFALHGNVDPIRDAIEVVYFDGKRPLFVDPGNHVEKFSEQLERIHAPEGVVADYEGVHMFLIEITECLTPRHRAFFDAVITDAYPGYEVKKKRVTRILPDEVVMGMFPGMKYDDQLAVEW